MNKSLFSALGLFLTASAQGATVLVGGESWQGYDVFDFESDGAGVGLNAMTNSGTNGGTWNNNSQGGKFVTNGAGQAVTDGDAGTWARSISYGSAITSGKWRLTFDFGGYDFDTFDGMTGVNDLTLELRNSGSTVAALQFRVHDDVGSDGLADRTQVTIISTNQNAVSNFSGKAATIDVSNPISGTIWDLIEIEMDLDSGLIYHQRNGTTIAGTGETSDTGLFTGGGFDEIRLSANGNWASTTADTGVMNTERIGLYSAIPEPTAALLGGLGFLALLRRRR